MEQAYAKFEEVFGRKPGPEDRLFIDSDTMSDHERTEMVVEAMRRANIAEDIVYAYQTTGLIVTTENQHLIPDVTLNEWRRAVRKYKRLRGSVPAEPSQQAFETVQRQLDRANYMLGSLIRRSGDGSTDDTPRSAMFLTLFTMFCLTRCAKTLKAIGVLLEKYLPEDALSCTRGIYESYLRLVYASASEENAEAFYAATAGLWSGTHVHPKTASGRVNYRICVECSSGKQYESNVSTAKMASFTGVPEDADLHDALYDFLSSFTHPDARQTPSYSDGEGFSALIRTFRPDAVLLALFSTTILIERALPLVNTTPLARADIAKFVSDSRVAMLSLLDHSNGEGRSLAPALRARIERLPVVS